MSLELAEKLDAEIISADSRQVYKHIQIATCAPTSEETQRVKHYFVNELELDEEFSAGIFAKKAKQIIDGIFSRGKNVIVAGGSGLYIKALTDGFYEEEIDTSEIRKKLNERLKTEGRDALHKELMKIDPETASKMDAGKFRRVIRALEVYYATGKKISELQSKNIKPDFESIKAGVLWERSRLYERINQRVLNLMSNGLVEEISSLREKGYSYKTHNSLNTVGVKEVFQYLDGELDKESMILNIQMNTRRYAKRQMTWFNADKEINWVKSDDNSLVEKIQKIYLR